jgi:NAD(P)-dependent dehydrogenase (short-subunit alcohol dehydrogenase family)
MAFLDQFSLRHKVVLLTGGAGLYGRGMTRRLAEAGAELVIASRNLEALETIAAEEKARGLSVYAESLDLTSEESILALRDRLRSRFHRLDGLVNNAVLRTVKEGLDSPLTDWEQSLRANATGLLAITRAMGAWMCEEKSGSIVNIGSIMGMVGPNPSLYEGTAMTAPPDYFFHKGGMISLTRYFASYYGEHGVRVNCLSPGGYFAGQDPRFVERYEKSTMLKRMANDDDLPGAIVFLLSAASSYITGANIPVDGGYTAK